MSASDVKAEQEATWGRAAAAWSRWDEILVRSKAVVSRRMLELGEVVAGDRVLDIASGTGEPALEAAAIVGPTGSVLGLDIAEPMLELAREKARRRGLTNVEFRRVDGEAIDVPPRSYDVATCRFGLMFMPDPLACLAGCRSALRRRGRFVAACWAEPARNPWSAVGLAACRRQLGLPAPAPGSAGMFALADPDRLRQLAEDARFEDVKIVAQETAWGPFASVDAAVTFVSEAVGPVATMLSEMTPKQRAAVEDELRTAFGAFRGEAGVALPGVAWIVTGDA